MNSNLLHDMLEAISRGYVTIEDLKVKTGAHISTIYTAIGTLLSIGLLEEVNVECLDCNECLLAKTCKEKIKRGRFKVYRLTDKAKKYLSRS